MRIVAEFRQAIGEAMPQIIALLTDGSSHVRQAGVNLLTKLSEHGKISNSVV